VAAALRLGSIVWVEIADANGIGKLRPAIVITATDRIPNASAIHVVAVTSRIPGLLPEDHVLLPWHRQGHPRTGLNRRCAAVCGWIAQIRPTDVREVGGVVPGAFMVEILRRVAGGGAGEKSES
jgi:mRNA-degrading endonuclease toxin of MazEF toxin-antitoxin module